MSLALGLVAAAASIWITTAACVAVLSRGLLPLVLGSLSRLEPALRANFLFVCAALPMLSGLLVVCFTLAPSVAHGLGLGLDHCHAHGHHPHLCLFHTAMFTGSMPERVFLSSLGFAVLAWAVVLGARLRRQRRVLQMLVALGRTPDVLPHHCVVRSRRAFAITAGWFKPMIVLSSRLLDELTPEETATVLAHERAHQVRRDGLRLFAAEILSKLHLPAVRRHVLAQLHLAAEQACDESAALRSGDRLGVAATIVKLSRLGAAEGRDSFAAGLAFIGADAAIRVHGLLRPPIVARRTPGIAALLIAALLVTAGFATSAWWHHSAESLLGLHLG